MIIFMKVSHVQGCFQGGLHWYDGHLREVKMYMEELLHTQHVCILQEDISHTKSIKCCDQVGTICVEVFVLLYNAVAELELEMIGGARVTV